MAFIDYEKEEVVYVISYFGPGLAGKTSNLIHLFNTSNQNSRSKIISLKKYPLLNFETTNSTFDKYDELKTRFRLQTVVMKFFSIEALKMSLIGVDGIIFVADSHPELMERNFVSMEHLTRISKSLGYDVFKNPYVLQLNKRDWPQATPSTEMIKQLRQGEEPIFETVATKGVGVWETFDEIAKQIHQEFNGNIINK